MTIASWPNWKLMYCEDQEGHRFPNNNWEYPICAKCGIDRIHIEDEVWKIPEEKFLKWFPPDAEDIEILKVTAECNTLLKIGSGMFCPDPEPKWVKDIEDRIRSVESSIDALNPRRRGF